MFDVNPEKFAEGRELYQRGVSLMGLIGRVVADRKAFEEHGRELRDGGRPDYRAAEHAEQSLTRRRARRHPQDRGRRAGRAPCMSRRLNLKSILADPVRRRELMICVIIATQAREGIATTPEQAARAYDKVQQEKRSA